MSARDPLRARAGVSLARTALLDRYEQHTKHCAVCSEALALTDRLLSSDENQSDENQLLQRPDLKVVTFDSARPLGLSVKQDATEGMVCLSSAGAFV